MNSTLCTIYNTYNIYARCNIRYVLLLNFLSFFSSTHSTSIIYNTWQNFISKMKGKKEIIIIWKCQHICHCSDQTYTYVQDIKTLSFGCQSGNSFILFTSNLTASLCSVYVFEWTPAVG